MDAQTKLQARIKRHRRVRKRVAGTPDRPRLAVFRSNKHIYAQLIDDLGGQTIAAASSLDKGAAGEGKKSETAKKVGSLIGARAKEKGITKVVFDRGGNLYHGRVRSLADAAREAGLEF